MLWLVLSLNDSPQAWYRVSTAGWINRGPIPPPQPRKGRRKINQTKPKKNLWYFPPDKKNNVEAPTIDMQRGGIKKPWRVLLPGSPKEEWARTQQDVNKLSPLSNIRFKTCQKFRLFNYSRFNMHARLPRLIKMHHFKSNCSRKLCFMLLQW